MKLTHQSLLRKYLIMNRDVRCGHGYLACKAAEPQGHSGVCHLISGSHSSIAVENQIKTRKSNKFFVNQYHSVKCKGSQSPTVSPGARATAANLIEIVNPHDVSAKINGSMPSFHIPVSVFSFNPPC